MKISHACLGNPASLDEKKMHNRISFSHNFIFASVQNGYVAYGRKLDKWNLNTHLPFQYVNYGDFNYADLLGNVSESFSAKETLYILGASKKLHRKGSPLGKY
ncbi:MAG: hypothetical protein IPJ39_22165 [Saprospiraceae bacterium]|nr:hypothetical protein [Saprospiraceae bacterium]